MKLYVLGRLFSPRRKKKQLAPKSLFTHSKNKTIPVETCIVPIVIYSNGSIYGINNEINCVSSSEMFYLYNFFFICYFCPVSKIFRFHKHFGCTANRRQVVKSRQSFCCFFIAIKTNKFRLRQRFKDCL